MKFRLFRKKPTQTTVTTDNDEALDAALYREWQLASEDFSTNMDFETWKSSRKLWSCIAPTIMTTPSIRG